MLAKGHSKLSFNGLFQRLIKLFPIAVGLFYGIEEFAIAMVWATFVIFIMYTFVFDKKFNISLGLQLKNFFVPNLVFFGVFSNILFFESSY